MCVSLFLVFSIFLPLFFFSATDIGADEILMVGPHLSGYSGGHVGTGGALLESSGPSKLAEPLETWGPVLSNELECEVRLECRKETCQSIGGERGASESLLSEQFSPPALANEVWGETEQPQSPFLVPWWRAWPVPRLSRLLPHQEKPELGSCPVRKSLFCVVRTPGEVKTWSCPGLTQKTTSQWPRPAHARVAT